MSTRQDKNEEELFAVMAELQSFDKPLYLTHLSFGRLIDDVIIPYKSDKPFFIDGATAKKDNIIKIKIIHQKSYFNNIFDDLHHSLRYGDKERQKIFADQYHLRLEAALREAGEDVTSQIIKAYEKTIKSRLMEYFGSKKDEILKAGFTLFMESIKLLSD